MANEKGGISVETEHIFPVIKKWLYSDKDIFLRETVSNACDACTKLKRLYSLGEAKDVDVGAMRIDVKLDREEKTITVTDNGIGMSADEVKRYINQIALSGALDFIEKYEGENGGDGIIGHFGLGFYSAFMVADKVEMTTKSYTDAPAVFWTCTEDGNYEMSDADEDAPRGTSVVMHITEDEKEYLDPARVRSILDKYCAFMPVEIYFDDGEKHECSDEECHHEHGPVKINETEPLWTKNPSDCTDEQYNELYRKLMRDYKDPLFHIHINADYPLNFKGILYFPKRESEFESYEGEIKLYYNQVFVADNIKEILPDYMIMMKGVLDCPDLPLNVSRSYLQNDVYAKKIARHISKKVADKLCSMCETERENYEKIWDDVKAFVLYGSMRDEKFFERLKGATLVKTTDGGYLTMDDFREKSKDRTNGKLYYCTDKSMQARYIDMLASQGITVAVFDTLLETQYVSMLEQKDGAWKFVRVDAEIPDGIKAEGGAENGDALKNIFSEIVGKDTEITLSALKDADMPLVFTVSEESRRINDMLKMYKTLGNGDAGEGLPEKESLCVNTANPVIAALASADEKTASSVAKGLVTLARMSRRPLSAKETAEFSKELCDIYARILSDK